MFVLTILQMESKANSLLYSKYVVTFLVPLLVATFDCWFVVVYFCDYNSNVTCICFDNYRFDVILIYSCCCNSNVGSIWSCFTSSILCFSIYIYSPIFVAAYPYSWEQTFYGIDSNGSRLCFNHISYHQLPSRNYPFLL
jgi:hypothetical protein